MKLGITKRDILFSVLMSLALLPIAIFIAVGVFYMPHFLAAVPDTQISRCVSWLSSTAGVNCDIAAFLTLMIPAFIFMMAFRLLGGREWQRDRCRKWGEARKSNQVSEVTPRKFGEPQN
jgi:hypothetical protein